MMAGLGNGEFRWCQYWVLLPKPCKEPHDVVKQLKLERLFQPRFLSSLLYNGSTSGKGTTIEQFASSMVGGYWC